ncbi:MAG TPA: CHASE3 domain-containing protein [Bacteroidota bacterium]|nr:CHASE3 domain-containing protein [Bacteroidota bacterium]
MRKTFRKILYISFVVITILFAGMGYYAKQILTEEESFVAELSYDHEVVFVLQDILISLQRAESNRRGFVITSSNEYVGNYNTAVKSVQQSILYLKQLNANGKYQDQFLDSLEASINSRLAILKSSIELSMSKSSSDSLQAVLTDQGQEFMTSIRGTILQLLRDKRNSRDDTIRTLGQLNMKVKKLFNLFLAVLAALALGLISGTYFHFKRSDIMEEALRRDLFQARQQVQHATSRYQDLKTEMKEKLKGEQGNVLGNG